MKCRPGGCAASADITPFVKDSTLQDPAQDLQSSICQKRFHALKPAQDNTLYETAIDQDGVRNEMSNGAGNSLFVGRTGLDAGYKRRRALLRFDLENALPPGAELIHAEFSMHQTKAAPNSPPAVMGLHRVLQSWGEGASNAVGPEGQGNFAESGDATWHHRLYPDELWTTPGGEYEPNMSAETTVGRVLQRFTWTCTQAMLADLRFWRDHPESNFGWVVVGGEDAGFSAHKFSSRENNTQTNRPTLIIVFSAVEDVFSVSFEGLPECTDEP